VPLKAKDALQSIDLEGTALNYSIKFHVMSGLPVGSETEANVSVRFWRRLGICELKR
jgi:hypothetical protein